jgi:hypothetical protein
MTVQSNQPTMKKSRCRLLVAACVLLFSGMLAGCSSPGDENVQRLVQEAYTCKNVEVVEFKKFDSMAGIYSYVAQFTFQVRFKDGEKGAKEFYKGVLAKMDMKGDNWEEWIRPDKVQDYIGDDCSEAGQIALERMIEVVLPQIQEKKKEISIPLAIPMVGWAEFMPGRKGWDITMRRDRVGGEPQMSEPVKREVLMSKAKKNK